MINLIPSKGRNESDIQGFVHFLGGMPTNYLISPDRKIIDYTSGGAMPGLTPRDGSDPLTTEEAYQINYSKLEFFIGKF